MKSERVIAGLFVLFQIWMAGSLGGSLLVLLLLAAAVIVALGGRLRIESNLRIKWSVLAVAGLVFVVLARVNAHASEAEDFLAWRAWGMGLAMFCIGFQVWELWERKSDEKVPGYLVPLGIAAIVCLFSQATVNRPAIAISTAIMAVYLAAIQFDFSAGKTWSIVSHPLAPRSLVIYAVLAGVAVTTGWIDEFFLRNVPRLQGWLETQVRVSAGQSQAVRSYVRSATLSSVALEKRTDPYAQALLIESTVLPGYLRGAAFDTFDGVNWRRRRVYADADLTLTMRTIGSAGEQGLELPRDIKLDPGTQLFPIHSDAVGPWKRLSVKNDIRRGEMFFAPLESDLMQFPGSQLILDDLDVVRGKIDRKLAYTFFVGKNETKSELSSEQAERLLRVPETFANRLRPLLPQVFSENANTSAQKIAQVEKYFNDPTKFKYSLDGFEVPKNVSPLIYFMEQRPAAHCEFFASGAALLLRLQGVPCRYVTGYIAISTSWSDNTKWIARNRDAHAWVEAYDAEAKTWRIVEATPGMNIPKSLKIEASNQNNQITTGPGTDLVAQDGNLWSSTKWWTFIRAATLDRWLMLIASAVLTAGVLWYTWQRYQMGRKTSGISQERRKLRAMLTKLDYRLRRRKIERERVETLHQFAYRIRASAGDDPWLRQAADWYIEYAQVVYGRSSDSQSLLDLAARVP